MLLKYLCTATMTAWAHIANWLPWYGQKEVCYKHYGCFSVEPPFSNSKGYLPQSPEKLDVSLILHTRNGFSLVDMNNFTNDQHFDKNKQIKVITHGFLGSETTAWVVDMKNELLIKEDVNIFILNWENGADECNYYQAVANTRLVAAVAAKYLIGLLHFHNISPSSVHLIGASLGAHVSGYIGRKIKCLDRISGLDPAGQAFEEYDKVVSLNSNDAVFVDVIHTDAENHYGIIHPVGDIDFYVNGGSNQPGCLFLNGLHSCSHTRAFQLFVESINSPCQFTAYPCDLNLIKIGNTNCTSCGTKGCVEMGYRTANRRYGIYYLKTNSAKPFCDGNVTVSNPIS